MGGVIVGPFTAKGTSMGSIWHASRYRDILSCLRKNAFSSRVAMNKISGYISGGVMVIGGSGYCKRNKHGFYLARFNFCYN